MTGSLQWLSSQTRPDIGAWVSLVNKGSDTSPADLATLMKPWYCRNTKKKGLNFQSVAINRSSMIVGYVDVSWANAQSVLLTARLPGHDLGTTLHRDQHEGQRGRLAQKQIQQGLSEHPGK